MMSKQGCNHYIVQEMKWETLSLEQLCQIELGKTPYRANASFWDKEKITNNVWVSIADLLNNNGNIVSDSKEYISDKGASISKVVKTGTILVSFKLTLGRVAFAGRDLFTNEAIAALTIKNEKQLSRKFLYYFLRFFNWDAAVEGDVKIKGKTLNKEKLKNIYICFPKCLEEQQHIVAVLDEAFAAIAKAKASIERNLKNAKELFESYLQSAFANPSDDWEERKLGEVCDFVRGPFGSDLKKSMFTKGGYAVYEQYHAIYNQFNEIRYFIDDIKFNEMKKFEVKPGELIMSCYGTIGKVAVAPDNIKKGIINALLLKIAPHREVFSSFLKVWMESYSFKKQIEHHSHGAAIQYAPTVKVLKKINISLPSLSEQQSIVAALDTLSAKTKQLEDIYRQKLANLEELKKSLLHKAFSGELTRERV